MVLRRGWECGQKSWLLGPNSDIRPRERQIWYPFAEQESTKVHGELKCPFRRKGVVVIQQPYPEDGFHSP